MVCSAHQIDNTLLWLSFQTVTVEVVEFVADDVGGGDALNGGLTALAADGDVQRAAVGTALAVGDGEQNGGKSLVG